jgi:hypothetical protein
MFHAFDMETQTTTTHATKAEAKAAVRERAGAGGRWLAATGTHGHRWLELCDPTDRDLYGLVWADADNAALVEAFGKQTLTGVI